MKGLIIKPYWADLILSGQKTWEIRGQNTNHRGHTEIIYSGTGHIYGSAELVESFRISEAMFEASRDEHQIEPWKFDISRYKEIYAWAFENPSFHDEPIPYKHPQGVVIWVNLPDTLGVQS
ncbi:ASCH domain protein [compost metagenome]